MKTTTASALVYPSRKLVPKQKGPYQVIKEHEHTVTIDVKGPHNTVLIDGVLLASEATAQVESPAKVDDKPSVGDTGNSSEKTVDKIVTYR